MSNPRIAQHTDRADLVFVGRVVATGAAPPAWSGRVPAFQTVEYQVVRVVRARGAAPEGSVHVSHPVVGGSPTARADTPGLSETWFAPGRELVVFASATSGGGWQCLSERDGALPTDDPQLAGVVAP